MTLDDLVARDNGKQTTDPEGQFKGECVSEWKNYGVDCLNIPYADLYVPNGAAKYIWYSTTSAMLKWFDKVGLDQAPIKGDTVVYDGNYGDVAMYMGNGQVFGQLGDPVYQPCAVRAIGSPLGFLRFKGDEDMATITDINSARIHAFFIGGQMNALDGADDADLLKNHVGSDLQADMYAWYNSAQGQAHKAAMLANQSNLKPYSGPQLFTEGQ